MSELKVCKINPNHIWMVDIPFCPYCNVTPEVRVYNMIKNNEVEKDGSN